MTIQKQIKLKVGMLILFSIAMGLLEAVVVVYLRLLYYPQGFTFPLVIMSPQVYVTEVWREAATLVMLLGASIAAGRKFYEQLAYFLLTFGVWDIFYYVFLKVFLDWPATLLDWDILFLIPTTWIGPVLSPVLCSLVMLFMAGIILHLDRRGIEVKFSTTEWILVLGGSLVIFYSYIRDYAAMIFESGLLNRGAGEEAALRLQEMAQQYVPQYYSWPFFWIGMGSILSGIWFCSKRNIGKR